MAFTTECHGGTHTWFSTGWLFTIWPSCNGTKHIREFWLVALVVGVFVPRADCERETVNYSQILFAGLLFPGEKKTVFAYLGRSFAENESRELMNSSGEFSKSRNFFKKLVRSLFRNTGHLLSFSELMAFTCGLVGLSVTQRHVVAWHREGQLRVHISITLQNKVNDNKNNQT